MKKIGVAFLAVVVLAGLLWWGYRHVTTAMWRPALGSREVATRVLGEYLAKTNPGSKALVIGNPFSLRSKQGPEVYAFEKASIRGFEEGFGKGDSLKVVYPELRKDFLERPASVYIDPKTTTPLSYLVSDNGFERLAEAHPGYDLMVSLIGLPVNVSVGRLWQNPATPRFGLLLPDWRIIGGSEKVRQALKSGKIAAAVVSRPGAASDESPINGKEYRSEFDRRFILVTRENIDELLQRYPQVF